MFNKYAFSLALVATLGAAPLSAASIDLTARGLERGTTVATGTGGVFYDDGFPVLTSDDPVDPILLDTFSGAIQFSFADDPLLDTALIDFDDPDGFSANQREFEIKASGDNGSNVLEFLLEEFSPTSGSMALLEVVFNPGEVNFSTLSPFDVFSDRANDPTRPQDAYGVTVELTNLNAITPIPLPAATWLLLSGFGLLGLLRRKRLI